VVSQTRLETYFFPEDLVHRYLENDHAFCLNVLKNMIQRLSSRLRDTTASLLESRRGASDGKSV
jgi:hypothetical protein